MKIVELIIDEEAEVFGIEAISLVDRPAIELDFVALKDQKVQFAEMDEDKRILMGPALVPDKPIYRKNASGEFYVYFSKATVRRAAELYLQHGNQARHTLEHEHAINGLTVVESWLVEDKDRDKSAVYGLDVPVGTWMVAVKVDNESIWQEWVKEQKVKGFSIEGYFADKMQQKEEQTDMGYDVVDAVLNLLEMESYSDYPDAVVNNAKRGIELNEKEGNKCATQVGKVRAQQLSQRKPLTRETIERMANYLSRAEVYYDEGGPTDCGYISYLLWGGKAGKRWADAKVREFKTMSALEQVAVEIMAQTALQSKVIDDKTAIIDDRLAYSTREAAEVAAKDIGCEGSHTHEFEGRTWYMPCKEHNLAEVGPRGGVKRSKKAPKSDTPNKTPKRGSDKNKPGAAASEGKVKVPEKVNKILQDKSDNFNERYKEKLGYGVSVAKLRVVYQRGVGAFQTSHSPNVSSSQQWGLARVNAFLYLVKNGRPENAKYTTDYDLLPAKHPKSKK